VAGANRRIDDEAWAVLSWNHIDLHRTIRIDGSGTTPSSINGAETSSTVSTIRRRHERLARKEELRRLYLRGRVRATGLVYGMSIAARAASPQGVQLRRHRDGHGGARVTGGRPFAD
jgi:hypothetical protein